MVRYGVKESDHGTMISSYVNKVLKSNEKLFGTREKAEEFVFEIQKAMEILNNLANWDYPKIIEKELE